MDVARTCQTDSRAPARSRAPVTWLGPCSRMAVGRGSPVSSGVGEVRWPREPGWRGLWSQAAVVSRHQGLRAPPRVASRMAGCTQRYRAGELPPWLCRLEKDHWMGLPMVCPEARGLTRALHPWMLTR